jgi:hypothetical protein
MRSFGARIEVQRVLLVTLGLWLLAGAYLGDPFWVVVLRAAGATFWTFLLAWSLTLDSAVARVARVAIGAGLVTGCAATFDASAPALLAVAVVAGGLLAAGEALLHRRVVA